MRVGAARAGTFLQARGVPVTAIRGARAEFCSKPLTGRRGPRGVLFRDAQGLPRRRRGGGGEAAGHRRYPGGYRRRPARRAREEATAEKEKQGRGRGAVGDMYMRMRKSGAYPTANHMPLCPVCQARDEQSGTAGASLTASIDLGRSTVVQHTRRRCCSWLLRCLRASTPRRSCGAQHSLTQWASK